VHREFVRDKARNTQYHTAANGWPNHGRYRAAFPFATGALSPGVPESDLSPEQRLGRQLFLTACVTCHDRPDAIDEQRVFALRSVSFPEGNYTHAHEAGAAHADPDDPYERHEQAPALIAPDARVAHGETLFQRSCAYCHAADGSGRNWIGAFLDPPPPDFRRSEIAARFTQAYLHNVTEAGIAGTSMPAWRQVLSAEEIDAVVAYMLHAFGAAPPRAAAR
jgi:cytochrome c oxidase cbb3-type subunit 3